MIKDGAVELYHNDSKKLETTTDGVQVTGEVVSGTLHCSGKLDLPDSPNATVGRVLLGDSDDLQLYHASNISTIKDNYGDLRILSNTLRLQPLVGNENFLYAIEGGTTRLFYDGATKFETISTGINVTGGVRIGGNNAANELDDYEEGSWTVGVDARLVTGSEGYYTKIGRLVICQFILNGLNAQTTGANISGIPFTSKNSNQIGLCTIGDVSGVSYSSGSSDIYGRVNANATNVQLLSKTTNGTSHSSTTFTLQTNVVLRGYIMYMTD